MTGESESLYKGGPKRDEGKIEMTTFVGEAGVSTYQAIVLKSALKLYNATGMKPNRMWTPTRMLALAGEITGQKFKRGQYLTAADALQVWIDANGTTGE